MDLAAPERQAVAAESPAETGAPLTPAQHRVIDELFARGGARPKADPGLALRLTDLLEGAIGPHVDEFGPGDLVVNKRALASVHQCEGYHVAQTTSDARFRWTPSTARGTIVHRALQLAVGITGDPAPRQLVDLAIDRTVEDGGDWTPRDFLRSAPPAELAELRTDAATVLARYQECFPPLLPAWRPRIESGLRAELCAGRVVLSARVDLALGRPVAGEARVLLIDFKTGRPHASHVDDLRFYALVETLRMQVPPFRVATYYLDAARWSAEDVTEATLLAAAQRVADGVVKLGTLRYGGRDASLTPGPACGWCPAAKTCGGAAEWEELREDTVE